MKRRGIKIPKTISRTGKRIVPNIQSSIIHDLAHTTNNYLEIGKKHGTTQQTVSAINNKTNTRNKLTNNAIRGFSGISFNHLPELVTTIPIHEQQKILANHKPLILKLFNKFKGKTKINLIQNSQAALQKALTRYSPELMTQEQFVTLVCKNIFYQHAVEQRKIVGIKLRPVTKHHMGPRNARMTKLSPKYEKLLTDSVNHYEDEIKRTILEKSSEELVNDVFHDTIVRAHQVFDPSKHPDMKAFLLTTAKQSANAALGKETEEIIKRKKLHIELTTGVPHLQNRPKDTKAPRIK